MKGHGWLAAHKLQGINPLMTTLMTKMSVSLTTSQHNAQTPAQTVAALCMNNVAVLPRNVNRKTLTWVYLRYFLHLLLSKIHIFTPVILVGYHSLSATFFIKPGFIWIGEFLWPRINEFFEHKTATNPVKQCPARTALPTQLRGGRFGSKVGQIGPKGD